jgi:hypothetical protein
MTDFRALCAELADWIHEETRTSSGISDPLVARARTALAQPEPQGPMAWMYRGEPYFDGERWRENWKVTLDEKVARFNSGNKEPVPLWGRPAIEPVPVAPTDEEIADEARKFLVNEYALPAEITYLLDSDNFEYKPTIGCFRAVLARFGRPAIGPVSVSERLPGPEDCDAEGCCWWWEPDCEQPEAWCIGLPEYCSSSTHWLPHWALPVPAPANTINQNNY